MSYFHERGAHYHRRCGVSRSCSGWEGVVPPRYGHQAWLVALAWSGCPGPREGQFGEKLSRQSCCLGRLRWGQAERSWVTIGLICVRVHAREL